jgi:apolipoprotein N-acyltransferase
VSSRIRSAWVTPLAGLLSGLLSALAFPPFEWTLLLALAPVPWIVALCAERRRGLALLSGVLFGLAFWVTSLPWIVYVVTRFGGQTPAMGVVCLLLVAAILSEWPALVAWGTVAVAPPGSAWRLAVFPVLWLASEHARSYVYGGFPWNLTGFALYRHPLWLQSASVWGVYGVGLLVMTASTLLAAGVLRRGWKAVAAAGLLVLGIGVWGAASLVKTSRATGSEISVALLQPNISQERRLLDMEDAAVYREVLDLTREAAAGRPDLIVLPESALPRYWERSALLRKDLTTIAQECGCAILFNDVDFGPGPKHYNAARLLTPQGLSGEPYRKVHLVPFGEYVPLPRLFFFVRQISTEIGEFSPVREPRAIPYGDTSIGMGICYEILYPVLAWKQVRAGAGLLATISNDSWYGRAGAQAQHFAGAVLRSVENRRFLLRSAITGISGIVDEKGRIRAELPRDRRGIVRGQIPLLTARTAWTRWGFLFSGFCDALSAGVLLWGLLRWRREGGRSSRPIPEGVHP